MYWDAQKRAIFAWRERNPEKYKKYVNEYHAQRYADNKETISQKKKQQYLYTRQAQIFRNILIDA